MQRFADGNGDLGTPEAPAVWLVGIVPGWSKADEAAGERPELRRYPVEMQLEWRFNTNAFRLLAALEGEVYSDQFAHERQIFVEDSRGYFKANLYPVVANNLGTWDEDAKKETGCETKADYKAAVRAERWREIAGLLEKHRPRLVIGVGRTAMADFFTAFAPLGEREILEIDGQQIVAARGVAPLCVVGHLSRGLHGHRAIASVGGKIREWLAER